MADAPAPERSRASSTATWHTAEDVIAAIAPHGKKGLARRVTRVLRGIIGNRART